MCSCLGGSQQHDRRLFKKQQYCKGKKKNKNLGNNEKLFEQSEHVIQSQTLLGDFLPGNMHILCVH